MLWELVKFCLDILLIVIGAGVIVGCACVCSLLGKALDEDRTPHSK